MSTNKSRSPAAGQNNDDQVARIIMPPEHPITLKQIDGDALFVLRKLRDAGFAGYLVGGGVRDLYLGKTPKDFDISTDARPGQLRKLFRNSRTIGRRFRLVQVFFKGNKVVEVSTLRSLSEHDMDGPESVLAPNNTYGTLGEDAQRRDLTINGLFFEIENSSIIDYVGGIDDLDNAIVRLVGEPEKRIKRDPVRMLRAIRHAARSKFSIEENSWQAICKYAPMLKVCPPSRLRDEFFKDLHTGSLHKWMEYAIDSELLFALLPMYEQSIFQTAEEGQTCREQLLSITAVIDRIQVLNSNHKMLTNDFLLALLLVPWACARFDLLKQQLKGADLFRLSKKIRSSLDEELAVQLNLRRSLRQEIVIFLCNLPRLIHHQKDGNWPKWLRKKSYFNSGLLFFSFYNEAKTEMLIPESLLDLENRHEKPRKPEPTHGKRSSRGRMRPAITAVAKKGGIFGFKK